MCPLESLFTVHSILFIYIYQRNLGLIRHQVNPVALFLLEDRRDLNSRYSPRYVRFPVGFRVPLPAWLQPEIVAKTPFSGIWKNGRERYVIRRVCTVVCTEGLPNAFESIDKPLGPRRCGVHLVGVNTSKNFEGMSALPVTCLCLASACGVFQTLVHGILADGFNGVLGWKRTDLEALAKKLLQRCFVRKKPAFHNLDHQVAIRIGA